MKPAVLTILLDGHLLLGRVTVKRSSVRGQLSGEFEPTPEFDTHGRPLFAEATQVWREFEAILDRRPKADDKEAKARYEQDMADVSRRLNAAFTRASERICIPELLGTLVYFSYHPTDPTETEVDIRYKPMFVEDWARAHPPGCIAHLRPTPVEKLLPGMCEAVFVVYFDVGCPCGERATYPLGYHDSFTDGGRRVHRFLSPFGLECSKCGQVSELLDTGAHGAAYERGSGPRSRFPCPRCGEAPMFLKPGFSYQGNDWGPYDCPAHFSDAQRERPQDFFGWFTLAGHCTGCGEVVSVTDFEVA